MEEPKQVRTAELAAALCLATDLGMGLPLEHGLQSTLAAMRLADRLSLDIPTRRQVYYVNLLFYGGCTADAKQQTELFAEGVLQYLHPVMFGSPTQSVRPLLRALGAGEGSSARRAVRAARKVPKAFRGQKAHLAAICEIIGLLSDSLGPHCRQTRQRAIYVLKPTPAGWPPTRSVRY